MLQIIIVTIENSKYSVESILSKYIIVYYTK